MIPELPVWSFRPNWRNPVSERLEWLTTVLPSSSGSEQRYSARPTPRRSFEMTLNPQGRERAFLDLWLHRIATNDCLAPLWHDKAQLRLPAAKGAARLEIDNTFREFLTDGYAIIFRSAFEYEVVEISGQDPTGLDLAAALGQPWGKGVAVYPLRIMRLEYDNVSLNALSSRVGEFQVRQWVQGANPYDAGEETALIFLGRPVLTKEPNRRESLASIFSRLAATQDGLTGPVYTFDEAGRAFTSHVCSWQARGRQASHEMRQMFYRLHGRRKSVWMPTFAQDVKLDSTLGPRWGHHVYREHRVRVCRGAGVGSQSHLYWRSRLGDDRR